jgi:acyl carrier protein
MIKASLDATLPGKSASITLETELIKDGILDSLDSMNFLFELEGLNGAKLEAIDETFDDFRVSRLVEILTGL